MGSTATMSGQVGKVKVLKSYAEEDPVKNYCLANSSPRHPVQQKLMQETMKLERSRMLGAPEVLALNTLLVQSLGAKKVLDVGVFTGASSLAAALALPKDGCVVACDVSDTHSELARRHWAEAGVADIIKLEIAPATETLSSLITAGQENTFDFAFIDADKGGYDDYYEMCLKLIRKGGIIAFDNTLLGGAVVNAEISRPDVVAVRKLNEKIAGDNRVRSVMMNIGDGYTLATKL